MHKHEEDPVALMQEHGVKPTANRILILRALLGAGRPLSMTEIETLLESVDKSIISRTLSAFREARLLHVLADGSESIRYEVCHCASEDEDTDRHVHFHCTRCGRTFCLEEIPVPAVSLPAGYSADHVNFVVEGICPSCGGA